MSVVKASDTAAIGVALPANPLWESVARLLDRAPSEPDLAAHRLAPLAAREWNASRPEWVTDALGRSELRALATHHAAIRTLRLVREAVDGEVMVFKGLAVAVHYPSPGLRPFNDIDILVTDPDAAFASLVAAGFTPVGYEEPYYDGLQHLRPLLSPVGGSLVVEIHRHVSWVPWCPPPLTSEILAAGRETLPGLPGVLVPDPAHHAVVIAAHSCATMPLRSVGDLLDLQLLLEHANPAVLESFSTRWRADRMWNLYASSAAALFGGNGQRIPRWAPNITEIRDLKVWERHVARFAAPFYTHRLRDLPKGLWYAFSDLVAPARGDTPRSKAARVLTSLRSANKPLNEHAADLGEGARRPRHRRQRDTEN